MSDRGLVLSLMAKGGSSEGEEGSGDGKSVSQVVL